MATVTETGTEAEMATKTETVTGTAMGTEAVGAETNGREQLAILLR
jgi:hypothetical protein